jgi:hypothetical protein
MAEESIDRRRVASGRCTGLVPRHMCHVPDDTTHHKPRGTLIHGTPHPRHHITDTTRHTSHATRHTSSAAHNTNIDCHTRSKSQRHSRSRLHRKASPSKGMKLRSKATEVGLTRRVATNSLPVQQFILASAKKTER